MGNGSSFFEKGVTLCILSFLRLPSQNIAAWREKRCVNHTPDEQHPEVETYTRM